MTRPGASAEEAVYLRQVRAYRRRFNYTMVHDRRDSRAKMTFLPVFRPPDGSRDDTARGETPGPAAPDTPAVPDAPDAGAAGGLP